MSLLFKRDINWDDVYSEWGRGSSFVNGSPRAVRIVAVYAAVSLIADMFSTLPQNRFRGDGANKTLMPLPQWLVKPDPRIDVFGWKYQFVTSLKLRGNAYGLVLESNGNPIGIRWLHPDAVSVDETDVSGPKYYVGEPGVSSKPFTLYTQGGQLIHIAEFVQPGSVKGLSPIAMFKQVFETAEYAMEYGHDWFEKAAIPASLLTAKGRLKPGQAAEAKKLFRAAVEDGGPVTLDAEWDYKTLTIAPNEAQFLETIKASATLIANIFRVTPEDIGGSSGDSKTYGNRQDDDERFKQRTLLPLGTRYETAMSDLLPAPQVVKLDLDAWIRPNQLDRARVNSEKLRNGTLTLPEARAAEDKPPLSEADVEFWQDNYQVAKTSAESISESVSESISKEG